MFTVIVLPTKFFFLRGCDKLH